MTDDKNEREHCERVANMHRGLASGGVVFSFAGFVDLLLSERAASFAQGEAQGYERGLAHAPEYMRDQLEVTVEGLTALQSKYDADVKAAYERGQTEEREVRLQCEYQNIKAYSDELEALQSKYETLAAAARRAIKLLTPGEFGRAPSDHQRIMIAKITECLDAALGPAPTPEEKL